MFFSRVSSDVAVLFRRVGVGVRGGRVSGRHLGKGNCRATCDEDYAIKYQTQQDYVCKLPC